MNSSASTQQAQPLRWTGWAIFAAAILVLNGMFSLAQGLVLLLGPNTYTSLVYGDLIIFDVTGWAWWNVIVGVMLLAAGGFLPSGRTWARVVAVIFVVLSAVSQLLLVPVQPFWALIVIAVDVFIIYALVVHVNDGKADAQP